MKKLAVLYSLLLSSALVAPVAAKSPVTIIAKCSAYYVHMENRGADTFRLHNVLMQQLYKSTSSTSEAKELYLLYLNKLHDADEAVVNQLYKPCLDLYLELK